MGMRLLIVNTSNDIRAQEEKMIFPSAKFSDCCSSR